MNKRLAKLHKRKVERARAKTKISEQDVRTPEQVQADREASRPAGRQSEARGLFSAWAFRGKRPNAAGGSSKTDA
jgi:hypothetical protein